MTIAVGPLDADVAASLRAAMRHLAGGVCVVTAGMGQQRTGLTISSAASLSLEPPSMLICVNRAASAMAAIRSNMHFAINVLSAEQADIADRFAGRGNLRGVERYAGAEWTLLGSGASGLRDALAVIDCRAVEILERYSHAIVIGRVLSASHETSLARDPLIYTHGRYGTVKPLDFDGPR